MSNTLVVGATGLLGQQIVLALEEARSPLRALVRDAGSAVARDLSSRHAVECVTGDLRARESLDLACTGVDTVVSTATAIMSSREGDTIQSVDEEGQLQLVEAAESHGVEHFVYISFPPTPLDYALQRAKRAVEQRLAKSRMTYTVLQPVDFLEVWLSPALGFDPVRGAARVFGDGSRAVSWISIHDVARFASAAARGGRWRNITLPLGGPDPLSPMQVLEMFAELGAPETRVEYVPENVLLEQLRSARSSREEAFAASMLSTAQGQVVDIKPALDLLPGRLRSVRDYAVQLLAT